MKKSLIALMFVASLGVCATASAAEPSLHEVYQAAEAGKLEQAQGMMREVLAAHPNSAKAHFVEAELLAKQGQTSRATEELAKAEKLAPGLPFANPQAVAKLKSVIGQTGAVATPPSAPHANNFQAPQLPQGDSHSGFPWSKLLALFGLAAFVAWAVKLMGRRNPAPNSNGTMRNDVNTYPPAYQPAYSPAPYGGNGPGYAAPQGPAPTSGGGLGSQILGGLATGAAVGAGVVASEALLHRFMEGNKTAAPGASQAYAGTGFDGIPDLPATPLNDMGGNDFGIADSAWDDAGDSDNDWN